MQNFFDFYKVHAAIEEARRLSFGKKFGGVRERNFEENRLQKNFGYQKIFENWNLSTRRATLGKIQEQANHLGYYQTDHKKFLVNNGLASYL